MPLERFATANPEIERPQTTPCFAQPFEPANLNLKDLIQAVRYSECIINWIRNLEQLKYIISFICTKPVVTTIYILSVPLYNIHSRYTQYLFVWAVT